VQVAGDPVVAVTVTESHGGVPPPPGSKSKSMV
jgi:hypothetical protein